MNIKFNGHGGKLRVKIFTLATAVTLTGAGALVPFAAVRLLLPFAVKQVLNKSSVHERD